MFLAKRMDGRLLYLQVDACHFADRLEADT